MKMAYKTLSVNQEVYDLLCAMKADNESFNDLFMRLLKGNGAQLFKFYGKMKDDTNEMDKIIDLIYEIR